MEMGNININHLDTIELTTYESYSIHGGSVLYRLGKWIGCKFLSFGELPENADYDSIDWEKQRMLFE